MSEPRIAHRDLARHPRSARILIAEAHPVGRSTLERACRCVATDVHVVASWRRFAETLDGLEQLRLPPDLVILGDTFASHGESEAIVHERFPAARVLRLPARDDSDLLASRLLGNLDRAM